MNPFFSNEDQNQNQQTTFNGDFKDLFGGSKQVRPEMKPLGSKYKVVFFIALIFVGFLYFYLALPIINIRSIEFYMSVPVILIVISSAYKLLFMSQSKANKGLIGFAVALFVLGIGLQVASSPIFNASKYQQQLNMTETTDFKGSVEQANIKQLPIVDNETAKRLGDKVVGEVPGLGSQFNVSDDYTLVNVKGHLYRIAPLEYTDFFKWLQNIDTGIPSYVMVDAQDPNNVQLVQLDKGMKYSPSGILHTNLERLIRFKYPTKLVTDFSFEVDDDLNPKWVVSTYEPSIGMFGAPEATGVIIVDPVTGEMNEYGLNDVPEWVDRIQPTDFVINQLNNYGLYVNGFLNTIFGQKDMLQVTPGHAYVLNNGHVNVYTGLTSSGADKSIVGFALIDLYTKESTFYRIGGADEYSAMSSAEGQVQQFGYNATFPILINIDGQPTYFLSLKDSAGLIKQYAFVSVKNYSIVGIGSNVTEAAAQYRKTLSSSGQVPASTGGKDVQVDLTIKDIKSDVVEGNTKYYILTNERPELFIVPASVSNELALSKVGDKVTVKFYEMKDQLVYSIDNFDNLNYKFE